MCDVTDNKMDPYALLNVSKDANDVELREAYKLGSRAFHPDKVKRRLNPDSMEDAEEPFLRLKEAYDILSNPVMRAAYDEFGVEGVAYLKSNTKSTEELIEYLSENEDDFKDDPEKLRSTIEKAMDYHKYEKKQAVCPTVGKITASCTAVPFLTGTPGSVAPLEMDNFVMHLNVGAPSSSTLGGKTSLSFGGYSVVKNGIGHVAAQSSLEYEIVPGTDLGIDVEVSGAQNKVVLNTSRKMANGTFVSLSSNVGIGGHTPSLTFASQRMLLNKKFHGTFSASTDQTLSLATTYFDKMLPLYRMALNFQPGDISFESSADIRSEDKRRNGKITLGLAFTGLHFKAVMSRALSRFSSFSIGLKLHSKEGVAWIFKLQRGGMSFNLPITLCTSVDPRWTIIASSLSILIDETIGKMINGLNSRIKANSRETSKKIADELENMIKNARIQKDLMSKQAAVKKEAEEKSDGLIIVSATYFCDGGDTLDVSTQLQFWVSKSSLRLPATSKCTMLGFYNVCATFEPSREETKSLDASHSSISSFIDFIRSLLRMKRTCVSHIVPKAILRIRYKWKKSIYEISVQDDEPLVLPSPSALKLGAHDRVS